MNIEEKAKKAKVRILLYVLHRLLIAQIRYFSKYDFLLLKQVKIDILDIVESEESQDL